MIFFHASGNDSLAAAVSWIIDHENDPDIDQMPSVWSFILMVILHGIA